MIHDLTEGAPGRVLTSFALPMFFSMLFQQVYNLADSMIAGRYIGTNALGAVGACYPVTVIFIAIASGLSLGAGTAVAQAFGKKAANDLKRYIPTAVVFLLAVSVAVTTAGLFLYKAALAALNMPTELLPMGTVYLKIYIFGIFFLFLYNISNSIFNALGDSKTPLCFLIFSSVLNILLDILFVTVFNLGIPGIAWATFISQALASCGSVLVLMKTYIKRIKTSGENCAAFDFSFIAIILKLGIPSVFQQVFISMGQLSLQSVINLYGADTVAGFSAGFKLNTLFVTTTMTLSNALTNYVAQNIGARKFQRMCASVRAALKISYAITAVIITVYLVFRRPLIQLFISGGASPEALSSGSLFLLIVSPFFLLCCAKNTLDGALRGMGAMKCFMAATFADIVIRILLGKPFSSLFGLAGVFWVWPVAWLAGTSLSAIFYLYHKYRLKYI